MLKKITTIRISQSLKLIIMELLLNSIFHLRYIISPKHYNHFIRNALALSPFKD